ncbi:1-deoxy-D-xylulose-5-phosphate synthase [Butyricicoccus sp. AM27-36]|uniref:1-deoxy-D-xylulose-5-phosphate synthase n=1 Tax=Butyricicoccus sp. AM27-36 TaxID=2292293 RepID=UPI000E53B325|nr:1-deoxy-D-xylulose-5-phosphate synthase [Butyricicoccus sp. AM27-36]RHT88872.1 1-deoxy-D-xylulose-5-phosphate synthase [Butyricicoccus sp. AM27-36]
MYIENINGPADVKKLNIKQMTVLASEIRDTLLTKLSRHGGHFGPNFGMVEATIALHYVFESPKDKFVFDVSHQSYPHKMLTGRKDAFLYEEHYDDVSGYSSPHESEHDHFTIGHTSTSVSLACGLAKGRDLKGEDGNVVAIIGDGSLSGGEALEALDYAAELDGNLIILVNDNDMSIAENHGGLYQNLRLLRETGGKAECNLFRAMGLDYRFVADGNDIASLIEAFKAVKDSTQPVVVHIVTQKGKGYAPAEQHKEAWHYCAPFHPETGEPLMDMSGECYESITLDFMMKKMQDDPSVCMITSGTPTVLGFTEEMRKKAGRQFIDVGIAEENAVALASGIAANGGKPVYGVYSTFIQRAYDQISQDLCINSNAATIIVAWGSVYGMNDVTHLGLYDIPMLANIPNLVYLAPTTKEEYLAMLDWSIEQNEHPVAIRMPGGALVSDGKAVTKDFGRLNTYEVKEKGARVAVIGLGSFYPLGEQAAALIKKKTGIQPTLINPYYITGVDTGLLESLKADHDVVITLEDGVLDGGFGEKIARFYGDSDMKVLNFGLKKEFLDRYDVDVVLKDNHLTAEQIAEDVEKVL